MTNVPAGMPLPSLLPKAARLRTRGVAFTRPWKCRANCAQPSIAPPASLSQAAQIGGGQTEHCRGGHSGNCKTQSGLKVESVLERQVFSSRQSGNPTQTHGAFQDVFLSAAPWPFPVRSPRAESQPNGCEFQSRLWKLQLVPRY